MALPSLVRFGTRNSILLAFGSFSAIGRMVPTYPVKRLQTVFLSDGHVVEGEGSISSGLENIDEFVVHYGDVIYLYPTVGKAGFHQHPSPISTDVADVERGFRPGPMSSACSRRGNPRPLWKNRKMRVYLWAARAMLVLLTAMALKVSDGKSLGSEFSRIRFIQAGSRRSVFSPYMALVA